MGIAVAAEEIRPEGVRDHEDDIRLRRFEWRFALAGRNQQEKRQESRTVLLLLLFSLTPTVTNLLAPRDLSRLEGKVPIAAALIATRLQAAARQGDEAVASIVTDHGQQSLRMVVRSKQKILLKVHDPVTTELLCSRRTVTGRKSPASLLSGPAILLAFTILLGLLLLVELGRHHPPGEEAR